MFKVGQKVWAFRHGWGRVDETSYSTDYPILVVFENENVSYTGNGCEFADDKNPSIFFKEIEIPADALVPPVEEIVLQTGDIVALQNGDLVYVELYSGIDSKTFRYHTKVPQSLEDAFDPQQGYKKNVKKVIGNING